ncbi:MAG: hypothetical protein OXC68_02715 [Aestuariivita sp.]|nr:hypothetical protein [Aestuariivita sp.]
MASAEIIDFSDWKNSAKLSLKSVISVPNDQQSCEVQLPPPDLTNRTLAEHQALAESCGVDLRYSLAAQGVTFRRLF